MASNSTFSLLAIFFLLISLSSAISDETIKNAAEVLSNSGYHSMSLTLPLISQPLISTFTSVTLFTPSDFSFSLTTGQPSLSLLQYHFCPRFYSFADLQSLSYGFQLPTLLPNFSLNITSSVFDDDVSINGVKISSSAVFDDGFFAIFAIDRFFNPNFTVETLASSPSLSPIPSLSQCSGFTPGDGVYGDASAALRSRGYSLMAAFLDLQVTQFYDDDDDKVITVFAPTDAAMEVGLPGNYSNWRSIFLRHVVGCELSWSDLVGFGEGFSVPTFLKGFMINVNHSDKDSAYSLMINGDVSVDFPEFYRNDKIVVHGLSGILVVHEKSGREVRRGAYSPSNHVEF
ncbi:hypothetical protein BVRB_6g142880 [Beta vulgaris subsp. vulgaris]|nr:hypothetical protein BVRB_6g142880 [Beta vulgaris subsp. vulgaris]